MTRPLLTILLFCAVISRADAQLPVVWFELTPDTSLHRVHASLYDRLEFLDSRTDTTMIGPIQTGIFNNQDANLLFKRPTQRQLDKLMAAATDSSAGTGTLLLQLRDFSFVQNYGSRYVFIRASMYVKADTIGHTVFNNFITQCLALAATADTIYSLSNLAKIDSIEKSIIPLYNTGTFIDGLYFSYTSFSRQIPDQPGMIKAKKDGSISSVHMVNDTGKTVLVRPNNIYAVVYHAKPYIATEYGFYPLEKVRDNFFFTGDIRIAAVNKDIITEFLLVGIGGAGAIAVKGFRETYDSILDPINGKFIHLRQIRNGNSP